MPELKFTLIQSDLKWENKKSNLENFSEKIKPLAGKTEIVALPEMFNTGFSMHTRDLAEPMDGESVEWMKKTAKENRIILTGSLMIRDGEQYFNRLIWMQPDGQMGIYDKRHLFSYAKENEAFQSGESKFIASVKGWKIRPVICYDLRFPVWCRQKPNEPYDVLLVVANWPESRIVAWKTLLQARAIENQCYVVAVNRVGEDGNRIIYNGASCVVNPEGKFLYLGENKEDIFNIALRRDELNQVRDTFPFLKDGDDFTIF